MSKTIIIVILSILSLSFAIAYTATMAELTKVKLSLFDIFNVNTILLEQIEKVNTSEQDIHKEDFIKFLSESRDWAYEYIENSQIVIKEIANQLNEIEMKDHANRLLSLLPEVDANEK